MKPQNFQQKNDHIQLEFDSLKRDHPEKLQQHLTLSWSNWGFGIEELRQSAERLQNASLSYIELHGNHYGPSLGYQPKETLQVLGDHGIKVAGICGMFSADNDLSSNRALNRQEAIDYIRRELDFAQAVDAGYMLVVPGAVGRPKAYDQNELERSVETLRIVANEFIQHGVKAAIEPIRSEEVSLVHTISDAKAYISALNHPGVQHINADVYHMQAEETHIGEALVDAGEMLVNLHMADSNRGALGDGSLDLDTIIMVLYLLGYNMPGHYVTPEPLGPGSDPYPAMYGKPDPEILDRMVLNTIRYFHEREEALVC
jgi:sugar phosphate isomerase/epimerase